MAENKAKYKLEIQQVRQVIFSSRDISGRIPGKLGMFPILFGVDLSRLALEMACVRVYPGGIRQKKCLSHKLWYIKITSSFGSLPKFTKHDI